MGKKDRRKNKGKKQSTLSNQNSAAKSNFSEEEVKGEQMQKEHHDEQREINQFKQEKLEEQIQQPTITNDETSQEKITVQRNIDDQIVNTQQLREQQQTEQTIQIDQTQILQSAFKTQAKQEQQTEKLEGNIQNQNQQQRQQQRALQDVNRAEQWRQEEGVRQVQQQVEETKREYQQTEANIQSEQINKQMRETQTPQEEDETKEEEQAVEAQQPEPVTISEEPQTPHEEPQTLHEEPQTPHEEHECKEEENAVEAQQPEPVTISEEPQNSHEEPQTLHEEHECKEEENAVEAQQPEPVTISEEPQNSHEELQTPHQEPQTPHEEHAVEASLRNLSEQYPSVHTHHHKTQSFIDDLRESRFESPLIQTLNINTTNQAAVIQKENEVINTQDDTIQQVVQEQKHIVEEKYQNQNSEQVQKQLFREIESIDLTNTLQNKVKQQIENEQVIDQHKQTNDQHKQTNDQHKQTNEQKNVTNQDTLNLQHQQKLSEEQKQDNQVKQPKINDQLRYQVQEQIRIINREQKIIVDAQQLVTPKKQTHLRFLEVVETENYNHQQQFVDNNNEDNDDNDYQRLQQQRQQQQQRQNTIDYAIQLPTPIQIPSPKKRPNQKQQIQLQSFKQQSYQYQQYSSCQYKQESKYQSQYKQESKQTRIKMFFQRNSKIVQEVQLDQQQQQQQDNELRQERNQENMGNNQNYNRSRQIQDISDYLLQEEQRQKQQKDQKKQQKQQKDQIYQKEQTREQRQGESKTIQKMQQNQVSNDTTGEDVQQQLIDSQKYSIIQKLQAVCNGDNQENGQQQRKKQKQQKQQQQRNLYGEQEQQQEQQQTSSPVIYKVRAYHIHHNNQQQQQQYQKQQHQQHQYQYERPSQLLILNPMHRVDDDMHDPTNSPVQLYPKLKRQQQQQHIESDSKKHGLIGLLQRLPDIIYPEQQVIGIGLINKEKQQIATHRQQQLINITIDQNTISINQNLDLATSMTIQKPQQQISLFRSIQQTKSQHMLSSKSQHMMSQNNISQQQSQLKQSLDFRLQVQLANRNKYLFNSSNTNSLISSITNMPTYGGGLYQSTQSYEGIGYQQKQQQQQQQQEGNQLQYDSQKDQESLQYIPIPAQIVTKQSLQISSRKQLQKENNVNKKVQQQSSNNNQIRVSEELKQLKQSLNDYNNNSQRGVSYEQDINQNSSPQVLRSRQYQHHNVVYSQVKRWDYSYNYNQDGQSYDKYEKVRQPQPSQYNKNTIDSNIHNQNNTTQHYEMIKETIDEGYFRVNASQQFSPYKKKEQHQLQQQQQLKQQNQYQYQQQQGWKKSCKDTIIGVLDEQMDDSSKYSRLNNEKTMTMSNQLSEFVTHQEDQKDQQYQGYNNYDNKNINNYDNKDINSRQNDHNDQNHLEFNLIQYNINTITNYQQPQRQQITQIENNTTTITSSTIPKLSQKYRQFMQDHSAFQLMQIKNPVYNKAQQSKITIAHHVDFQNQNQHKDKDQHKDQHYQNAIISVEEHNAHCYQQPQNQQNKQQQQQPYINANNYLDNQSHEYGTIKTFNQERYLQLYVVMPQSHNHHQQQQQLQQLQNNASHQQQQHQYRKQKYYQRINDTMQKQKQIVQQQQKQKQIVQQQQWRQPQHAISFQKQQQQQIHKVPENPPVDNIHSQQIQLQLQQSLSAIYNNQINNPSMVQTLSNQIKSSVQIIQQQLQQHVIHDNYQHSPPIVIPPPPSAVVVQLSTTNTISNNNITTQHQQPLVYRPSQPRVLSLDQFKKKYQVKTYTLGQATSSFITVKSTTSKIINSSGLNNEQKEEQNKNKQQQYEIPKTKQQQGNREQKHQQSSYEILKQQQQQQQQAIPIEVRDYLNLQSRINIKMDLEQTIIANEQTHTQTNPVVHNANSESKELLKQQSKLAQQQSRLQQQQYQPTPQNKLTTLLQLNPNRPLTNQPKKLSTTHFFVQLPTTDHDIIQQSSQSLSLSSTNQQQKHQQYHYYPTISNRRSFKQQREQLQINKSRQSLYPLQIDSIVKDQQQQQQQQTLTDSILSDAFKIQQTIKKEIQLKREQQLNYLNDKKDKTKIKQQKPTIRQLDHHQQPLLNKSAILQTNNNNIPVKINYQSKQLSPRKSLLGNNDNDNNNNNSNSLPLTPLSNQHQDQRYANFFNSYSAINNNAPSNITIGLNQNRHQYQLQSPSSIIPIKKSPLKQQRSSSQIAIELLSKSAQKSHSKNKFHIEFNKPISIPQPQPNHLSQQHVLNQQTVTFKSNTKHDSQPIRIQQGPSSSRQHEFYQVKKPLTQYTFNYQPKHSQQSPKYDTYVPPKTPKTLTKKLSQSLQKQRQRNQSQTYGTLPKPNAESRYVIPSQKNSISFYTFQTGARARNSDSKQKRYSQFRQQQNPWRYSPSGAKKSSDNFRAQLSNSKQKSKQFIKNQSSLIQPLESTPRQLHKPKKQKICLTLRRDYLQNNRNINLSKEKSPSKMENLQYERRNASTSQCRKLNGGSIKKKDSLQNEANQNKGAKKIKQVKLSRQPKNNVNSSPKFYGIQYEEKKFQKIEKFNPSQTKKNYENIINERKQEKVRINKNLTLIGQEGKQQSKKIKTLFSFIDKGSDVPSDNLEMNRQQIEIQQAKIKANKLQQNGERNQPKSPTLVSIGKKLQKPNIKPVQKQKSFQIQSNKEPQFWESFKGIIKNKLIGDSVVKNNDSKILKRRQNQNNEEEEELSDVENQNIVLRR